MSCAVMCMPAFCMAAWFLPKSMGIHMPSSATAKGSRRAIIVKREKTFFMGFIVFIVFLNFLIILNIPIIPNYLSLF